MRDAITLQALDEALETAVIGSPMPSGRNYLGIEVERLILHRETQEAASLWFCRQLLADLAEDIGGKITWDSDVIQRVDGEGFSFTMEPGGQLELATDPRSSVGELDPTMDKIRRLVNGHLADTDYTLDPRAHTPVSKASEMELLPRSRYRIMNKTMTPRGPLTPNMMRATAGFQLTYDVTDRVDAGRKLALLNRLAPVMAAISANSRTIEGRDSGFASYRHYVWLNTDRDRVGIPEGGLHAETAVDGYIRFARKAATLFLKRDGELIEAPQRSFEQLVAEGEITPEDLDLHLSSLFPFVRLRNYLEVRYLDAVSWELARSMLALLSGLVYCPKATAAAQILSADLVPVDRAGLDHIHLQAAKHGLDAQTPAGGSFRDLARLLVEYSSATLGGENCGWADPDDLEVVAERIG